MNRRMIPLMVCLIGTIVVCNSVESHAQSFYQGPTAVGVVRSSGESVHQLQGIQSRWDSKNKWYEVKIHNVNYFWLKFSTVVTPKKEGLIPSTTSVNNRLIVRLTDRSGNRVQGDFSFISYRLKPGIK